MIHIEQQWAENYCTTAGELMHKKAHEEGSFEKRGNILVVRGLRIAYRKLGQLDVPEKLKDSIGRFSVWEGGDRHYSCDKRENF